MTFSQAHNLKKEREESLKAYSDFLGLYLVPIDQKNREAYINVFFNSGFRKEVLLNELIFKDYPSFKKMELNVNVLTKTTLGLFKQGIRSQLTIEKFIQISTQY